ncbi:Aste57867_975 [Aphanomyces stellatus]|uniref:Aste57867_975 protein n=1 Tax=Aphanomyces stellatus TaxID=120398 RepID=A0A485K593_9STRA|nr:hypothetical protein As57867_000974 [Aphanomyces stellatus]VFT78197.1 Aste57867_975 [Aphanomyces stellatus]
MRTLTFWVGAAAIARTCAETPPPTTTMSPPLTALILPCDSTTQCLNDPANSPHPTCPAAANSSYCCAYEGTDPSKPKNSSWPEFNTTTGWAPCSIYCLVWSQVPFLKCNRSSEQAFAITCPKSLPKSFDCKVPTGPAAKQLYQDSPLLGPGTDVGCTSKDSPTKFTNMLTATLTCPAESSTPPPPPVSTAATNGDNVGKASSAPLTPASTKAASSESSNSGAIIGGVVGGIAGVALLAGLFVLYRRRRRQFTSTTSDEASGGGTAMAYAAVRSTPNHFKAPLASPSNIPRTPVLFDGDGNLDYTKLGNLLTYLSTRADLKDLWMPISTLKTSALKGGDHLLTVSVHGKKAALKGINYPDVSPATRRAFVEGVLSIHRIHHPQITSVQGVTLVENHTKLCVVTEYMEKGSIGSVLLDAHVELEAPVQARMAADVARGLMHIHAIDRVYGDLSPDKVLVNGNFECKLNVLQLMKAKYVEMRPCPESYGTVAMPFQAPEVRRAPTLPVVSPAADVYSFGVLVAYIFVRQLPHRSLYHECGFARGDVYLKLHPEAQPYDDATLAVAIEDTKLKALVMACWRVEPTARPQLEAILAALEAV